MSTYNSELYTFEYPDSYAVAEVTNAMPAVVVSGMSSRVEIFKDEDFDTGPTGERLPLHSGSGEDEHEAALAPKERLQKGDYSAWLFYGEYDAEAKQECAAIFQSLEII